MSTTFKEVSIQTPQKVMKIQEARFQHGYQFISNVGYSQKVDVYGAVVGRNGTLINSTDYVSYEGDDQEV